TVRPTCTIRTPGRRASASRFVRASAPSAPARSRRPSSESPRVKALRALTRVDSDREASLLAYRDLSSTEHAEGSHLRVRPFLRAVRLFGQDERMAVRALLETILPAALALVLCIAAIAVWSLVDGSTLAESIESGLSTAPLVGYPLAAVALGWLIVNLASKRSSSAARFWFNLLI